MIYDFIQVLNSYGAPAGCYHQTVGFIRVLDRTLDSLQTVAAWCADPSYAKDIEEQAAQFREPVESF
jgi:hypothetical protein